MGHNGSPYDYVIVDIDIDIDRDRPLTGVQEHSYTKRVGENKARQKKTNINFLSIVVATSRNMT